MNATDFSSLVPWVIAHGYLLFFIASIFEGPLVTAAGGVAAALGYYNIFLIILLAIGGDVGGDFFYYGIGHYSHNLVNSGKLRFLGITAVRIEKIKALLHTHVSKTVLFVKLTPVIGPAGLIILGAVRAPFNKIFKMAMGVAIPKTIFFALIGFYSASAYVYLDKTIQHSQKTLAAIIIIAVLIYFVYQKVINSIAKRLEK